MELTFVHQYSGDAPKRRRLAKACETCRARKKRCVHFADGDREGEGGDVDDNSSTQNGASERTPIESSTQEPSPDGATSWSRFYSDLTPESLFLNRPQSRRKGATSRSGDEIGMWVDRREWDAIVRQRDAAAAAHSSNLSRQRPHSAVLAPLIDIYFRKIHPLLPLLDEDQFRREHKGGTVPEPLAHALCMIAAKDSEAVPHLRMNQSSATLTPRDFCSRMHDSVKGALKATCRFDKITLIRILALASLHNEGPDGAEEASMCLSQAMHHAQTIGLHLGQHSDATSQQEMSMKRLFWCLWTLDRSNAAMNGRPLVMADIDIAIDPIAAGETGFPAFEAWLRITEDLNRVLGFYRPNVSLEVTGWEDIFPDYEQLIDDVHGWHLPQPMLATIHIYFLSVAILSHRCRGIKQTHRGTHSSNRQRLCATEVVRFMQSDHCKSVHAMPVIPYAVSLALSVSYQHLRQSQLIHQQEDARNDFRACTRILQSLRRTWCSVDTIVALAKRVLDELDRAQDLAVFRLPRKGQPATVSAAAVRADAVIHPPSVCPGTDGISQRELEQQEAELERQKSQAMGVVQPFPQPIPQPQVGFDLFDGMDDVFGTYLDPNYPVHLDDLSFLEDLPPLGWNTAAHNGTLPGGS